MLYFHSVKSSPGLRVDIVEDVRHINTIAVKSFKTGSIILGGGPKLKKICEKPCFRNFKLIFSQKFYEFSNIFFAVFWRLKNYWKKLRKKLNFEFWIWKYHSNESNFPNLLLNLIFIHFFLVFSKIKKFLENFNVKFLWKKAEYVKKNLDFKQKEFKLIF